MIHKIIGGMGKQKNIKSSISYLLRKTKQEEQIFVKVLSNTTEQDLLIFNKTVMADKKHPYVCGVLSFAEKDIKESIKMNLINDFEDALFAGIEPENRPPILWVQHTDKGRLELNYLTFNQLQNGKAYTTYLAKRDNKLLNALTRIYDIENGFKNPDDTNNKHIISGINKRLPKDKKELLQFINNNVISSVVMGYVNNRNELEKYLEKELNLKINRRGENYLSVVPVSAESSFRPIRLKGEIYEKGRNYAAYRTTAKRSKSNDRENIQGTIQQLRSDYTKYYENKSQKNNKRYRKAIPGFKCGSAEKTEEANSIQASSELSNTNTNNIISCEHFIVNSCDAEEIRIGEVNNGNDEDNYKNSATRIDETIRKIRNQQQDLNGRFREFKKEQQKTKQNIDRFRSIFCKCIETIRRFRIYRKRRNYTYPTPPRRNKRIGYGWR